MSNNPRIFPVGSRDQRLVSVIQDLRREVAHIKTQANNTAWFAGSATFTGDGSAALFFNIVHGLGLVPKIFLAIPRNWGGYLVIRDVQTITATNDIGMEAIKPTDTFVLGTVYTVNWLASIPATSA